MHFLADCLLKLAQSSSPEHGESLNTEARTCTEGSLFWADCLLPAPSQVTNDQEYRKSRETDSVCLFAYLSVCLFVCPSVCLFVCLSLYLSIYLSIDLSIYLSIWLLDDTIVRRQSSTEKHSNYLHVCVHMAQARFVFWLLHASAQPGWREQSHLGGHIITRRHGTFWEKGPIPCCICS